MATLLTSCQCVTRPIFGFEVIALRRDCCTGKVSPVTQRLSALHSLNNCAQLLQVGDIVTHINDEVVLDAEQAREPAR